MKMQSGYSDRMDPKMLIFGQWPKEYPAGAAD